MDLILGQWSELSVITAILVILVIIRLQRNTWAYWPQSAKSAIAIPTQINEYVYEVSTPSRRRPSIELLFFHGLQVDGSKDVYLTTWLSADGLELWPKWILSDFPDARILVISYDAFARRTVRRGLMDMYRTTENLVQDLTGREAHVGQAGCPVVLVGHGIGGLLMKAICITLESILGKASPDKPINLRVHEMLCNVKGLFFYSCPHQGSRVVNYITNFSRGRFVEDLTVLNEETQRRNEESRKFRTGKYKWKTYGVGEGCETTIGRSKVFVTTEASSRLDVDDYYTDAAADYFTVCRPKSKKSSNVPRFSNFIADVLKEDNKRHSPKLAIPYELVGLEGVTKDVMDKLQGTRRLGVVGMGGIGKTTLAEVVYNTISQSFDCTCFLKDVKSIMAGQTSAEFLKKKILEKLCYK